MPVVAAWEGWPMGEVQRPLMKGNGEGETGSLTVPVLTVREEW